MFVIKKILSAILLIAIFVCAIPLNAFAADQVDINTSAVEDDLKDEYGNLDLKFPKNILDTKVYLVSFMESGYTSLSGEKSEDYGLYLYIYNPSGKDIISEANMVQFGIKWEDDGKGNLTAVDFKKYPLSLLDMNDSKTLIKLRVRKPDGELIYKDGDSRRYDISGIELHEKKYTYKDCTVGYSYTFTGFGKGMSVGSLTKSTLKCKLDSFMTLKVAAHQVSYLSGDSELGTGFSNQVNSVYFSVPSDIEKKYGDLYSIKYEYYHYYTRPMIVTDNVTSYNTLLADRGKYVDDTWKYSLYHFGSVIPGSPGAPASVLNYDFNYGKEIEDTLFSYYNYHNNLSFLTTVFLDSNGWERGDIIVSSNDLQTYFRNYKASYHTGKAFDYSADLFNLTKSKGYKVEEKSIDEVFSLESYKDTHNWLERWLDGIFDDYNYDNSIKNARYIQKVDSDVLNIDASKSYLVDGNQIGDLRSFYLKSATDGNSVYLLRYAAADDYYSLDLEASGLDGDFMMAQGNVYLNFDFIYFTFGDSENHTVLAVVSDPSDGFPNLTDTTSCDDPENLIRILVTIIVILVVIIFIVNVVLPVVQNFLDVLTKKKRTPKPPKQIKKRRKKFKFSKIKGRKK